MPALGIGLFIGDTEADSGVGPKPSGVLELENELGYMTTEDDFYIEME